VSNTAVFDEDRIRDVLGLDRGDGTPYEAYQIGRGPTVASWDRLDGSLPEYERFSLEQLYFPPGLGTILAQVPGVSTGSSWFGMAKKEMLRQWQSWLTIFIMSEDDNEGVFGRRARLFCKLHKLLANQSITLHLVGLVTDEPRQLRAGNWRHPIIDIDACINRLFDGYFHRFTIERMQKHSVVCLGGYRVLQESFAKDETPGRVVYAGDTRQGVARGQLGFGARGGRDEFPGGGQDLLGRVLGRVEGHDDQYGLSRLRPVLETQQIRKG